MSLKQIGLTGGIGCGKSTVSGFFSELGACVIDADILARQAVLPASQGFKQVVGLLGQDVVDIHTKNLDRKKIASLVFAQPLLKQQLEVIVHPIIAQLYEQCLCNANIQGYHWVIYDAALLIESQKYKAMDLIIVIDVPHAIQKQRLMLRDGLTDLQAQLRIQSQMPTEEKKKYADIVIDNSQSVAVTYEQVKYIFNDLKTRFG